MLGELLSYFQLWNQHFSCGTSIFFNCGNSTFVQLIGLYHSNGISISLNIFNSMLKNTVMLSSWCVEKCLVDGGSKLKSFLCSNWW